MTHDDLRLTSISTSFNRNARKRELVAQASRQRELSKQRNVQQFGDSYKLIFLRWASADIPKCEGALSKAPAITGVGAPFPDWDRPQPLSSVPGKSLPW